MGKYRGIEIVVGAFMLFAILCLLFLAYRVSSFSHFSSSDSYVVTARFDGIGSLKVRAPVDIAGVPVGQVESVTLDKKTFQALVKMRIKNSYNDIPADSSASILTEGLLGANYVGINPGYSEKSLKNGDNISMTHRALDLSNMIGQFLFSVKK